MKTTKIFIASSVAEFEHERNELGNYIRQLDELYLQRGIHIQLVLCEDLSNAVAKERKQDEYNNHIRESQYFYVIFGKEAGAYTIEEFDIALKQFKQSGAPKLYTYFRTLPEGENAAQSVTDFVKRLDSEIGHFYSMFSQLDSIKLNMLIELTRDPELYGKLEFEDGHAVLDGKQVLSLEKVPMYSKNEDVLRMKTELEQLNEDFAAADTGNMEAYKKRSEQLATQRAELSKQLHTLEMDILGLFQRVSKLNNSDRPLTWREKRAIELVDKGNYDRALNILRDAKREQELEQAEEVIEIGADRVCDYILEDRLRIDTLKARGWTVETIGEITPCYETIVKLAEKYRIELDVLYDYAGFLWNQKQFTRGIEIAERLQKRCELGEVDRDIQAPLLDLLGLLYANADRTRLAARCYQKALESYYLPWMKEHPECYGRDVVRVSTNLADLLYGEKCMLQAEKFYILALNICKSNMETNASLYKPQMGRVCNNYANLLKDLNRVEKAEVLYCEALGIYKNLATENSSTYELYVAGTCKNLAFIEAVEKGNQEAAKALFEEALSIYEKYPNMAQDAQEVREILKNYF